MHRVLRVVEWVGLVVGGTLAVLILGFLLVPPATRGFTDAWGATSEEVAAALPGDQLFPAEREVSTKAITIAAPPDVVYALIRQMGQHRAGWYGWDWFYRWTGSAFVLATGTLATERLGAGALPETWSENSMAWVLTPTPEGGTRLVLRMRADGTETGFARWLWNGPLNFGGALFSRKTMVGIRRTAEALALEPVAIGQR